VLSCLLLKLLSRSFYLALEISGKDSTGFWAATAETRAKKAAITATYVIFMLLIT